ncbi:MAG: CCA tRNA nucleotidyltransferase [Verrucomicrobiales bacterium]|nr:CCA tRNA nucleotidyltransferase [Verrucomicrobiales bacterium]
MREEATEIVRNIRAAGHEALFNGGCVRDLLLGKEPKDIDIATSATPDEILELYPKANTIGAHFGVVLVKSGDHYFEIATFREDGDYRDGRRPNSVRFSTAERDAQRRDFTVNGMFLDPETEEVIDYVGGKADLETRTLRAIGDPVARFEEDYLRMLRAVRFATVLEGFEIESETRDALCRLSAKITEISAERIREELDKIWLSPNRVSGFDLLADSGLMKAILPEILELRGCEQPPQWHPEGDVYVHTRIMLDLLEPDASLPLVLSVLFHDIAKPATFSYDPDEDRIRFNGHDKLGAEMTRGILRRLRYSNEIVDAVCGGVERHMQFKDVQKMRTSKLKRFMARETFPDELELHRVDCESSNGFTDNYDFLKEKEEEFANEPLIPKPFLTGRDLVKRGWKPGPKFGKVLREAQDLQLEGRLETRDQALDWLDDRI